MRADRAVTGLELEPAGERVAVRGAVPGANGQPDALRHGHVHGEALVHAAHHADAAGIVERDPDLVVLALEHDRGLARAHDEAPALDLVLHVSRDLPGGPGMDADVGVVCADVNVGRGADVPGLVPVPRAGMRRGGDEGERESR